MGKKEADWSNLNNLRFVLNGIKLTSQLEQSPLINSCVVETELIRRKLTDTPRQRSSLLANIVERYINDLRPQGEIEFQDQSWVDYLTLRLRYLEKKTRLETSHYLRLGMRTYDRLHRQAIERLARILQVAERTAQEELETDVFAPNNNLPRRIDFVPRPEYLNERILNALDVDIHQWIVLILGSAGMGKSELATEAAYQSLERQWFDNAIWIDARVEKLTPFGIEDVKDSIQTIEGFYDKILEVLQYQKEQTTTSVDEKRILIHKLLANARYLIVIDNFDTLPDDTQKMLVDFILSRNGLPYTCKVIVTSRIKGSIEDGRIVEVKGMNSNQATVFMRRIAEEAGVQQLMRSPAYLIEEFRAAVDGSPLAMKWNIGRMKSATVSLKEIIDDLENADKTSDLLEYSFRRLYELVQQYPIQRKILSLLSLFPDPLKKQTLAEILDLTIDDVDEAIIHLSRSLLVEDAGRGRFTVLQLVRLFMKKEFDIEQQETNSLKMRANTFYQRFLETHWKDINSFTMEKDNIFAVMRWILEAHDWQSFVFYVKNISSYLFHIGAVKTHLALNEAAISWCKAYGDRQNETLLRSREIGLIFYLERNYVEAEVFLKQDLQTARLNDYKESEGWALGRLGIIYRENNRLQEAQDHLESAIQIFYQLDDLQALDSLEGSLITVLSLLGEFDKALRIGESQLQRARDANDYQSIAQATGKLGSIAERQQNLKLARKYYLEALDIELTKLRSERKIPIAYYYEKLCRIEKISENWDLAEDYLSKAIGLFMSDDKYSGKVAELREFATKIANSKGSVGNE